jgi:hypothetical protein
MVTSDNDPDEYAYELLKNIGSDKQSEVTTKVVFVPHISDFQIRPLARIKSLISLHYVTFMFVAEHVYLGALQHVQRLNLTHLNLNYFFPVMSLEHLMTSGTMSMRGSDSRSISNGADNASDKPSFVMQVSIAARHGARKNPVDTTQCLFNKTLSARQTATLTFIGRHEGTVDVSMYERKKAVVVNYLNNLSPKYFYRAISQGKFFLTGINDVNVKSSSELCATNDSSCNKARVIDPSQLSSATEYYTRRSTSVVPAALMTHVPLVMHNALLDLYPCLRDRSPVHRLMSGYSECEAIGNALSLSDEQYSDARREIVNCYMEYQQQAKSVFEELLLSST